MNTVGQPGSPSATCCGKRWTTVHRVVTEPTLVPPRQTTLDLEGMGRGRWKEKAQFSPQAPPDQNYRGMIRYWSSVAGRLSSWLGSHSFRALRGAKKAEEGRKGSLEEADAHA